MKQRILVCARTAAAAGAMMWLASPAEATVVATYTDRASWAGSLTAVETADFNETMAQGGDTYQTYNNNVGYTDPSGILTFWGRVDPSTYELSRTTVSGARLLRAPIYTFDTYDPRIEIGVLSSAARGFGVDISSSIAGVNYTITVNGTDVVSGGSGFLGFRTDSAITQIVIRAVSVGVNNTTVPNGTETFLDDASVGEDPVSETPEPSTVLSFGTGLLLLVWTRRRTN